MTSSPSAPCVQASSKGIDRGILSLIQHLDITANVTYKSQSVAAYGGFSEVFRGRLRRDGHTKTHIDIAIKRLRFHVDEEKVKKGIYEDSVDAAGGEVKRGNEDLLDKSKFPQDRLETLLHIAASQGNKQLVEWLIDHSMLILFPPS